MATSYLHVATGMLGRQLQRLGLTNADHAAALAALGAVGCAALCGESPKLANGYHVFAQHGHTSAELAAARVGDVVAVAVLDGAPQIPGAALTLGVARGADAASAWPRELAELAGVERGTNDAGADVARVLQSWARRRALDRVACTLELGVELVSGIESGALCRVLLEPAQDQR